MTLDEIKSQEESRFTVKQYRGVAFYFYGPETEPDEDTEWTGQENETGNALMVMVGDDHKFSIDPEDVALLAEEEYCHECGQVGCTADGIDRSEEA